MLKFCFLIFVSLVCGKFVPEREEVVTRQESHPQNQSRYFGLKCSPDTIYAGDTLRIEMNVPNPGWLAVVGPTGSFSYIARPPFEMNELHKPMISDKELSKMKILLVSTEKAKVFDRIRNVERPIFEQTGLYKIQLGDFVGDGTTDSAIDKYYIVYVDKKRD